jgi:hypothetical protein
VLLVTGGALEHNLFLCFICDSLCVVVLLVRTWVLSLCSSFPPWLGALFNEACQGFVNHKGSLVKILFSLRYRILQFSIVKFHVNLVMTRQALGSYF